MPLKQVYAAYTRSAADDQQARFKFCPTCAAPLGLALVAGQQRPTCARCGFVQYLNPLPGVVVVIAQEDKILLGQRNGSYGKGKWGLPQGFIEHGEDFLSAAVREVREETGLQVRVRAILNVVHNYLTPQLHTLAIILLAEIVSGEPKAADDLQRLRWLAPDDPIPPLAFEADYMTIARYRETKGSEGLPVDPRFAAA